MRVIKSITTTDTILVDSNIPEDEYPMWVGGTSYSVASRVIYNHIIYEAILANSSTTTPNLDETNWLSLGATNRYRMFDTVISNISSRVGGIKFTLAPSQIVDGVALIAVSATTARVVVTDPVDGVVYDKTKVLRDTTGIVDYYSYFFSPIDATYNDSTVVFDDLPSNRATSTITVYINSGSSVVSIGEVVYGKQSVVGRTNYNTAFGITSYSRKDVDEFGTTTVIKRKNSKYCDFDIDIDNSNNAFVYRLFSDIDSVPCVFIGNSNMEEIIVYGFYKDFKATITYPTVSKCTLRVEGLI
jgi:hypothetical protein